MPVQFSQLPAYGGTARLNFEPLTNALYKNRQLDMEQQRVGFEGERVGLEKKRFDLEERNSNLEYEGKTARHFGGLAQMIHDEKDPELQTDMFNRFLGSDPRIGQQIAKHLPPELHRDPVAVSRYITAVARGYQDPLDVQQKQAAIASTKANTAHAVGGEERAAQLFPIDRETKQRELDTPQQKMTIVPADAKLVITDTRTSKSHTIDNGNQKLSDKEREAILDVDKNIQSGSGALGTMRQLRQLNRTAYDGRTAGARGYATSTFGSGPGQDTEVMHNLITKEALEQLRATFGGNPTEGERKILIEVQGSVNQPATVRDRIFAQAEQVLNNRLMMNRQQGEQIRNGTYFRPGGGGAAMPQQPSTVNDPAPVSQSSGSSQAIRRIQNDAEYDQLAPGERYVDPNGVLRTKK